MQISLFDQVDDVVRALLPDDLGEYRSSTHRRGIKVWFGPEKATRSHFEAQVLRRRHVDGVEGMALEVGFHAEHGDLEENEAALNTLLAAEADWREILGAEAEAAEFFDAPHWRRLSEAWIEPDLDDPELAFEIASRLADYLIALQPHLPPL